MNGLTDYISEHVWVDTFLIWYVLIDDAYQELVRAHGPWRRRGPEPVFSDSEVITVALIIETYFHGHEEIGLSFLDQYHRDLFPHLLDKSRFNRQRRQLSLIIEQIRRQLTALLLDPEDRVRVIDSAPIPACTYTRSGDCQTVSGAEYASVMASKGGKLYGHRFYATMTNSQLIDRWMLAPAAPNEGKMSVAFFEDQSHLWVLADNGFHAPTEMHWLEETHDINLITARRRTDRQRWTKPFRQLLDRLRRRIETALSVLSTVFHLEAPGSRSLSGLIARTATSVLAYNLSFLTNIELSRLYETSN
jgi:hypothetical protein